MTAYTHTMLLSAIARAERHGDTTQVARLKALLNKLSLTR
jgi:hypothetical protein